VTINITNLRGLSAVRPATNEDVPFLIDLFLRAMRGHITEARGHWDETKEQTQFLEQLQLQHTQIVECEGMRAGFLMTMDDGQDIELHTLCIAPEYQRRGLGTAITRQLIADALARKCGVALSVLKVNTAARSFYTRLGFILTEESEHHYRMRCVC
jgi:ribosomal protein S18 acetylase RimI-like enzyme